MGPWSDLEPEMPRYPLDDGTVDALLRGAVSPDDAPPELRHAAALVAAARRGPEGDELRGADAAVAGFTAAAIQAAGTPDDPRRRSMRKKLMSARVLAIAAPVALLGAGTAAAAADALPAPAQAAASSALAHLDVSVPNPNDTGNASHGAPLNTSKGKGPDATANSPATFGLCTAFTAGGLSDHSVAYRNLYNAAPNHDIAAYCAPIIANHANSNANPDTNGGSNDNGTGSANQPSDNEGSDNGTGTAPFTTPPVSVPSKGKPSSTPPSGVPSSSS